MELLLNLIDIVMVLSFIIFIIWLMIEAVGWKWFLAIVLVIAYIALRTGGVI